VGPLVAGAVAEWSYAAAFGLTGVVVVLAFTMWLAARETLPATR
jgi:DHA1 family tetracycline resistance protein-like MFS transporter